MMYFVVGIGRCGTSTVARVLHQNRICCLGHEWHTPDKFNPQGYWEDLVIRKKILSELQTVGFPVRKVYRKIYKYHKKSGCDLSLPFGFKEPRLCRVPHARWIELEPKHIFWAQRPAELIINSLKRWKKEHTHPKQSAEEFFYKRQKMLEKALRGLPHVTIIDFSDYRTDSWVLEKIKEGLDNDNP